MSLIFFDQSIELGMYRLVTLNAARLFLEVFEDFAFQCKN